MAKEGLTKGLLVFVRTGRDAKGKAICGYYLASENTGQPINEENQNLLFFSNLLKKNMTPGTVIEVEYSGDPEGDMTIHGRKYAGRWSCPAQVLEWQTLEQSREQVARIAKMEADDRNLSLFRKQLEPIREAIRPLHYEQRRLLAGWIVAYLLG